MSTGTWVMASVVLALGSQEEVLDPLLMLWAPWNSQHSKLEASLVPPSRPLSACSQEQDQQQCWGTLLPSTWPWLLTALTCSRKGTALAPHPSPDRAVAFQRHRETSEHQGRTMVSLPAGVTLPFPHHLGNNSS